MGLILEACNKWCMGRNGYGTFDAIGGGIYFGLDSPVIPVVGSIAIVLPIFIVPVVSILTEKIEEEYLQYIFNERHCFFGRKS